MYENGLIDNIMFTIIVIITKVFFFAITFHIARVLCIISSGVCLYVYHSYMNVIK